MSSKYKQVANGKGTDLTIGSGKYISVGKNGTDVTIRGNGRVIAFNTWEDFVNAIDVKTSAYFKDDEERENKEKEETKIGDYSIVIYDKEVSIPMISINGIDFEVKEIMKTLNKLSLTASWECMGVDNSIQEKFVDNQEVMNKLVTLGIAKKFVGIADINCYKMANENKFNSLYEKICDMIQ